MSSSPYFLWLAINLAMSAFMAGLVTFVQHVHYPLFREIQPENFALFHEHHSRLTSHVVAPVMAVELLSSVLIFYGFRHWTSGLNLLLTLIPLGLTFLVQVPLHRRLARKGWHKPSVEELCKSHHWRSWAWALKALSALFLILRVF